MSKDSSSKFSQKQKKEKKTKKGFQKKLNIF